MSNDQSQFTRRDVLKQSGILAGTATSFLVTSNEVAAEPGERKLTVVVAGAHPDDPETGCGGTMLRYAEAGHDVVALYLTRGEAGIRDKSHAEAAGIRTAEA